MARHPPSPATTLRKLRRERAHYAQILAYPQTPFPYRQRLRRAIAIRDRRIAALALVLDDPAYR